MTRPHDVPGIFVSMLVVVLAVAQTAARAEDATNQEALRRDLTVEQRPVFQLRNPRERRRIEVDAWVDHSDLTYTMGEALRLSVRPRQSSYITVVDVGSSGRAAILFPNHFQRSQRIPAGSTVTIPAAGDDWKIKVHGPAGVDLIEVIASRSPLTLRELDNLARTTPEHPVVMLDRSGSDVARDLTVELDPGPSGGSNRRRPSFGVRNVLIRVLAGPS
jgi:hypothetical protein